MQISATSLCLLGLAAVACASNSTADSQAVNSTSRAFSTTPDFGQTVERVLARALGTPERRLAGVGAAVTGFLASIPLKLAKLEALLVVAAPGIAIAGLVIAIIALAKVGALYKKLGLSSFDTVKEAIGFGLPGNGFPEEGGYDGYGRYDPTEYAYHDDDYAAESSYTSYASRRGEAAGQSGAGQQKQTGFTQRIESRVSEPAPSTVPYPVRWS